MRRREPLRGSNRHWRTWLLKIGSQAPAYLLLSVLSLLAIVPFMFLIFSAFKPYIYLTRYDVMIAGSLLTVLPVLVAYAFSQRTFVRGAQTSGLKG